MRGIKISRILARRVLAGLMLAGLAVSSLTSLAVAAPVYRHLDAQGNVVYSDEPQTGRRVDLAPITVVDPTAPHDVDTVRPVAPDPAAEEAFEYAHFSIASPGNEQTIPVGQAGNVQVKLAIEPALRRQDRVQLRVDGEIRQSPMHSSVFALSQLERGEHRLQAELVDGQGETRLATPSVTIYVQRASVNLPRNPNNPNR